MQIIGEGAVRAIIRADGVVRFDVRATLNPDDPRGFVTPLPAGYVARKWSVELHVSANAYISELHIVHSPKDLKNV
jgi:hypothetical protein